MFWFCVDPCYVSIPLNSVPLENLIHLSSWHWKKCWTLQSKSALPQRMPTILLQLLNYHCGDLQASIEWLLVTSAFHTISKPTEEFPCFAESGWQLTQICLGFLLLSTVEIYVSKSCLKPIYTSCSCYCSFLYKLIMGTNEILVWKGKIVNVKTEPSALNKLIRLRCLKKFCPFRCGWEKCRKLENRQKITKIKKGFAFKFWMSLNLCLLEKPQLRIIKDLSKMW